MSKVSYNQLTDLTGFSFRTLKKRMDGLQPVGTNRTKANLWDSAEALPLIYAWRSKAAEEYNGKTAEKLELTNERAMLAREQRIGQEIKNARERQELIPSSAIAEAWGRIVSAVKRQLLALPGRLAQMLETSGSTDERRAIIEKEIKAILEGLAKRVE